LFYAWLGTSTSSYSISTSIKTDRAVWKTIQEAKKAQIAAAIPLPSLSDYSSDEET